MFSRLTWKKVVDPSVVMGERMSVEERTWMRKTSAMDRFRSCLYSRDIRTSPFKLKMKIPEIIGRRCWPGGEGADDGRGEAKFACDRLMVPNWTDCHGPDLSDRSSHLIDISR